MTLERRGEELVCVIICYISASQKHTAHRLSQGVLLLTKIKGQAWIRVSNQFIQPTNLYRWTVMFKECTEYLRIPCMKTFSYTYHPLKWPLPVSSSPLVFLRVQITITYKSYYYKRPGILRISYWQQHSYEEKELY